jgi:translation initiation factor 2 subunit 1
VNTVDPQSQVSFKLIAPPHYRIETVTLKKNEGLALLERAMKEVEGVIKEKGGTFKMVNKPQIIGDSAKDKDLEEIMKMPGERDSDEEGRSSGEEDNDEGMGDIDLGEDGEGAGENDEVDGGTKKKPKKKVGAAAVDDSDSDDQ